jgi:hypothetical protein
MALSDYERRRENELNSIKEELWAQQQEGRLLRERVEVQRKALEEKKADISGFKVIASLLHHSALAMI